jgi:hypothetical protein
MYTNRHLRYPVSMSITISHTSALYLTRWLRSNRLNLAEMDRTNVDHPQPWVGKRWTKRNFVPDSWQWQQPTPSNKLDILVGSPEERIRMAELASHVCSAELPPNTIIWLDDHATMAGPELLFAQMAETLPLANLVLLGHELCGHFSRCADFPAGGPIVDGIPAATSTEKIARFLKDAEKVPGRGKATAALAYLADHALSAPEALLATVFSLPAQESGYGMGPVTLNQRIEVEGAQEAQAGARYPDLMFAFAPVGINYDGEGHLDLTGLAQAAREAELAGAETKQQAERALADKLREVREKAVDDLRRNRQLAASGLVVFPVTKEDLHGWGQLDVLARDILSCAHAVFGADVRDLQATLDDAALVRNRYALLSSLLAGE